MRFIDHAWRYGTENTIKVAYNEAVTTAMMWRRATKELSLRFEEEHPKLRAVVEYLTGGAIGCVLALYLAQLYMGADREAIMTVVKSVLP